MSFYLIDESILNNLAESTAGLIDLCEKSQDGMAAIRKAGIAFDDLQKAIEANEGIDIKFETEEAQS